MSGARDPRERGTRGNGPAPRYASLRLRLTGLYLVLVTAATAALGVGVYRWTAGDLLAEREVRLLTEARIAANAVAPHLARRDAATRALEDLSQELGARLLWVDGSGTVRADSLERASPGAALASRTLLTPEVRAALDGREATAVVRLSTGEVAMYAAVPVVRLGVIEGALFVSASLEPVTDALGVLARRLAVATAAVDLVFLAVTWTVAAGLTGPLVALSRAARRLGAGALGTRVPVAGGGEVAALARSFNRMAEQLEGHDQAQRRFIADASHELRTPLSAALLLAEALEREAGVSRPRVDRLKEQLDRMSRLVEQLLELARLDEGAAEREPLEPTDLAEVVRRVARRLEPVAAAKGVRLEVEAVARALVAGSGESLERIVQNLVENAVKYTTAGGSVRVEAGAAAGAGGRIALVVADTGAGIAPEALPHIFDRFARADPGRAREAGGFGLGLAIVRRRVEAMGGSIEVSSAPGRGTRFRVLLPSANPGAGSAP